MAEYMPSTYKTLSSILVPHGSPFLVPFTAPTNVMSLFFLKKLYCSIMYVPYSLPKRNYTP